MGISVKLNSITKLIIILNMFKVLEKKFQQELKMAKEYCAMLTSQLDSLRMVPALFGVINF